MQYLPERVRVVTERLMEHIDAQLPKQLEGFYLVGSVAQEDYQEGRSDIDFVAVMAGQPEVHALVGIHADLARAFPDLDCDGIYVLADELVAPAGGEGVRAREGKIDPRSTEERHPVTWLLLADEGISLRGRRPDASWIAADRASAQHYSRANLSNYWRKWLDACRRYPAAMDRAARADDAVTWGALGVARVHATIASGRVPSKTAAGAYALDTFPHHERIITEALRLRTEPDTPSLYRSRSARRRDLVAFMDAVITSAPT